MVGIEIIDKYTNFYAAKFSREGLDIDRDEIASELGEAYADALDGFDETRDVKLGTYVIAAFKNRMRSLQKESSERPAMVSLDEYPQLCVNGEHTAEDLAIAKSLHASIIRRLKGRELIVFREMVNPSDRLCDAINGIMEMQKDEPHRKFIAKGSGIFRLAMNLVYGYSYNSIWYEIKKIRKKAEKVLDLSVRV